MNHRCFASSSFLTPSLYRFECIDTVHTRDVVSSTLCDVVRSVHFPSAMASRPFGWRVFAAPWCCGDCCYTTACFPCYNRLYDYVEQRVQYLALVAGVAPPAPPPFSVIPGWALKKKKKKLVY